jgi:hypothetical protein
VAEHADTYPHFLVALLRGMAGRVIDALSQHPELVDVIITEDSKRYINRCNCYYYY